MNRDDLIAELIYAAEILRETGCLPATDGNFSARIDLDRAIVTRSAVEKRTLLASDIIEVSIENVAPHGATSEWKLHRALYQARPDIQCVLHVHSPALTAFACASRIPNVKLLAETEMTLGGIALIPFCPPGSSDLGEFAVRYGGTCGVLILERHGAVSIGSNVRETLHRLERAELLARAEIDRACLLARDCS